MTKQKQSLIASFLIGFAILVGLDQWTKGLVVQSLKARSPLSSGTGYLNSIIRKTGALPSE